MAISLFHRYIALKTQANQLLLKVILILFPANTAILTTSAERTLNGVNRPHCQCLSPELIFIWHKKGGLGLRFCMYSLHLLIEIKLHMKLCWHLFHCICCFLEYLWIKCPLNSLLLVPWSKINGNFRFVTSSFKNLVAPFCFCSAKRCKFYGATFESNFSLCDFICCRSKIIKFFWNILFFLYIMLTCVLTLYLLLTRFLHYINLHCLQYDYTNQIELQLIYLRYVR